MTRSGARLAALVRIVTGLIFVVLGTSKVFGEFVHGGFAAAVKGMIKDSWPVWRELLQSVVLPIAHVFGWVVAVGEIALGLGLLLGFWTQVVAAGGALLMLSILLSQSYAGPGASLEKWVMAGLTTKFALLLLLLLAAADAGRVWGLDGRVVGTRKGPVRR
ncbi:MAG: DoxX family membrane protein [Acidobacteriota bacterium]|nr:DoxX family membrane protein [Acidobacteriota bacterium]